jgi:serine/threonine protein kinase
MSLTKQVNALPEPLNSKYEIVTELGQGSYAVVYQVRHKRSHKEFALKVIEKEPMRIRSMMPQLKREVVLGEEVSGYPHIVQMMDVTETSTHYLLRFELCSTSLDKVCEHEGPMTEPEALRWLCQACLGVQELHANNIIHRDLKPGNFLIDSRGSLRICDFGFACRTSDKAKGLTGTTEYCPPEGKGDGAVHSTKMDIYSLGACLQHLLLGRIPHGCRDMPEDMSSTTEELLEMMMSPKPQDRPDIDEVIEMLRAQSSIISRWRHGWQFIFSGLAGA